ncbi:MAG: helix-turn-helix domain-containing protein [Rickettsiales bacterium]|jgi:excisionase family DNA binding protein|nr:helix-turn-helix domain-containing protein [Rickettsiales bacterium]
MQTQNITTAPNETYLTTIEVAKLLQFSANTLRMYRCDGMGPAYVKVGRLVRYRLSDVQDWCDKNRQSYN